MGSDEIPRFLEAIDSELIGLADDGERLDLYLIGQSTYRIVARPSVLPARDHDPGGRCPSPALAPGRSYCDCLHAIVLVSAPSPHAFA